MSDELSYLRYLEAKRSVDDRALNRNVVDALRRSLPTEKPLRVLEIGGGTGSMVRRCLSWSLLGSAEYHLVDVDAQAISALPELLATWAEGQTEAACLQHDATHLELRLGQQALDLHLSEYEIADYLSEDHGKFDLIIANAVLDLVDLKPTLQKLWAGCTESALFWFTINFDGESIFMPELSGDTEFLEAYHLSMDRRTGTRYTGRSLFAALDESGAAIMESGSSDWVVHAGKTPYRQDEAYFLRHIIHTIEQELSADATLDQARLREWIAARKQQIADRELVYIAHQLDFVGTAASTGKR